MVLTQIWISLYVSKGHSLTLEGLNLPVKFEEEWNFFIDSLSQVGLFLDGEEDILVWEQNVNTESVYAKLSYEVLVAQRDLPSLKWWNSWLWKGSTPLKVKC